MPQVVPFVLAAASGIPTLSAAWATALSWAAIGSSSAIGLHERTPVLDQRDAQLKAEIAESMHRNRPGWVN